MTATPGQSTTVNESVEKIIGDNNVVLNDRPFVAGSYVYGEIVGRVAADGKHTTYVPAGTGGEEIPKAICGKTATLASDDYLPIIYGDFQREGVEEVMSALTTPITVTEKIIGELDDVNVHLKRR
jgi:hypothetical protein